MTPEQTEVIEDYSDAIDVDSLRLLHRIKNLEELDRLIDIRVSSLENELKRLAARLQEVRSKKKDAKHSEP